MDEKQIAELEDKKYIAIEADSKERSALHQWADDQKYLHIGYVDKKRDYDIFVKSYRCRTCDEWIKPIDTRTRYCCTDEKGNQACGDWLLLCNKCDDDVWSSDATQGDSWPYKRRIIPAKNMILIVKETDLQAAKPTLNAHGIKLKYARSQIAKQSSR